MTSPLGRLANDTVEILYSLDFGPRILSYRLLDGGENVLRADCGPGVGVDTPNGRWNAYGGHRLWAAPEVFPLTYAPDNTPLATEHPTPLSVRLLPPSETHSGLKKELALTLAPVGSTLEIIHSITNTGPWPVSLAPWALSIMAPGGTVIIPQEPFRSHDDDLLPARSMIFWSYTDLSDPRWLHSPRFLRLTPDSARNYAQKIGLSNTLGWAAYAHSGSLFVKKFPYHPEATYPDRGCNCEFFTKGDFLEIESLAPLLTLHPGQTVTHPETCALHPAPDFPALADDATLAAALEGTIKK